MTFDRAYVASLLLRAEPGRVADGIVAGEKRSRGEPLAAAGRSQEAARLSAGIGYEVVSFGKVGHYQQTPE